MERRRCEYEAGPHTPLLWLLVAGRWVLCGVPVPATEQVAGAVRWLLVKHLLEGWELRAIASDWPIAVKVLLG